MNTSPRAAHVSFDKEGGRDLYLLAADRPEQITADALGFNHRYFVTLLAWDTSAASTSDVLRLARVLLDAGCVYFCCWGPGCERTHDLIDEEYLQDGQSVADDESTIMTTWHERDSLSQAAWFTLNVAFPDDRFIENCKAVVAVCIGNEAWSGELSGRSQRSPQCGLTIHSSRTRFAGRLNSSVRPHSMPARFLYLDNSGSPTQWDGTRYLEYLTKVRPHLPSDLQSLTAIERYKLPSDSDLSLWRSDVTYIQASRDGITFAATNDYGTRRFEFTYSGVSKFQTTSNKLHFLPTIVIQELVKLRNGLLRHTFSDMRGNFTTIHASSLSFQESLIQ